MCRRGSVTCPDLSSFCPPSHATHMCSVHPGILLFWVHQAHSGSGTLYLLLCPLQLPVWLAHFIILVQFIKHLERTSLTSPKTAPASLYPVLSYCPIIVTTTFIHLLVICFLSVLSPADSKLYNGGSHLSCSL